MIISVLIAYKGKRVVVTTWVVMGWLWAKGCINMQKAYHNSLIGKSAYPYNNYLWEVIVSPFSINSPPLLRVKANGLLVNNHSYSSSSLYLRIHPLKFFSLRRFRLWKQSERSRRVTSLRPVWRLPRCSFETTSLCIRM